MRALVVILTALAVIAGVATFALTYAAIFTHDGDLGAAAYVTLILTAVLGGSAAAVRTFGGAA